MNGGGIFDFRRDQAVEGLLYALLTLNKLLDSHLSEPNGCAPGLLRAAQLEFRRAFRRRRAVCGRLRSVLLPARTDRAHVPRKDHRFPVPSQSPQLLKGRTRKQKRLIGRASSYYKVWRGTGTPSRAAQRGKLLPDSVRYRDARSRMRVSSLRHSGSPAIITSSKPAAGRGRSPCCE